MIKLMFKLIVKIRKILNPVKLPKDKESWDKLRVLKLSEFCNYILKFPYKSDKIGGLIDKTESFEHFIDPNVKSGRDCDDYALMYHLWGIFNGKRSSIIIVTDPKHPFKKAHVVTVLYNYKSRKYLLCNYKPVSVADSLKSVLEELNKTYPNGFIYEIQTTQFPMTELEILEWAK